ncbi:MAG: AI-2E family transporter [Bryobacteraceae bacterium]
MDERRATLFFLVALTGIALYFCYLIAAPFLTPVLYAAMMAVVCYPLHNGLLRRLRRPTLTATISTLFVLFAILIPIAVLITGIAHELALLKAVLHDRSSGDWTGAAGEIGERVLRFTGRWVDLSQFDLRGAIVQRLQAVSAYILSKAGAVVGNLTSFVGDAFIAFFTLFFLFREGSHFQSWAASLVPLRRPQFDRLFLGISDTLAATVHGGLAVAATQGTLIGLAFWVLGLTAPMVWGIAAALFSLVPLVGSAVVWVPGAIYLWATGHWIKALILTVWSTLIVGSIDNILRPLLIRGRVELHTLPLFFSLLGGVQVFGLLGVFVGPVVLAVTMTLIDMLREEMGAGSDS